MATKKDYTFRYRVSNWRDYNRALVDRGRITFWFDEAAVASWRCAELNSKRGTPKTYSDTAIDRPPVPFWFKRASHFRLFDMTIFIADSDTFTVPAT